MNAEPLLQVSGLQTWFGDNAQPYRVVDGIDFAIQRGETFALLGESGCGKSMTALSLLRLNPTPASRITAGQAWLNGEDLMGLSEAEMEYVRGRRIAMIFQEPQTSLNPVLTVRQQISECLRWHFDMSDAERKQRCLSLLESVGIPDPERRLNEYPHQFSGGMKQRVMIAMALAGEPELLIADEPTTALDVTIQAQILGLLKNIQRETGMAIMLITHDLGVVAQMADHVAVMYAGQIIEMAPREQFFSRTRHPYTKKLFEALPSEQKREHRLTVIKGTVPSLNQNFRGCRFAERCDFAWQQCYDTVPAWIEDDVEGIRCHLYDNKMVQQTMSRMPVPPELHLSDVVPAAAIALQLNNLKVHFPIRKGLFQRTIGHVKAVDGVTLTLNQAETLALVGESGCGKTTLGKAILQLLPVTAGTIVFQGDTLDKLSHRELKTFRANLQIVFQDPFSSMNPRMTVSQIIDEGLTARKGRKLNAQEREKRIDNLLQRVGLRPELKYRFPHEFSGGQRQRICIARALAAEPEVIICDEPTSALDVSVQAQILNLLRDIQHEFGLSYLFITHNIAVVNYLAHRVAVMYLGRIVEQGTREDILLNSKHPYTQALLAAVPHLDVTLEQQTLTVAGELPSPANPPPGCHFHKRCPYVMPVCHEHYPITTAITDSHQVNCFLYEEDYGSTDTN